MLPRLFKSMLLRLPTATAAGPSVTHDQFWLLGTLNRGGPMTMGALAAARDVALNTATAQVDRLVQAGLVERRPVPSDRRVVVVAATDRGREAYADLLGARTAALARMLDGLSAGDLELLERALPALRHLAELPAELSR